MARLAVESVLSSIRDPALQQQARVQYELRLRASTAAPGKRQGRS
jgi:LacI family transcriptional regulator